MLKLRKTLLIHKQLSSKQLFKPTKMLNLLGRSRNILQHRSRTNGESYKISVMADGEDGALGPSQLHRRLKVGWVGARWGPVGGPLGARWGPGGGPVGLATVGWYRTA